MIRIAGIVIVAAALAGCSNLNTAINALSEATVTPKEAGLVVTAFSGAEGTMAVILATCTPASRPAACNDVNLHTANKAMVAGNTVASALQTAIHDNPKGAISGTDYQKLNVIVTTLNNAISAYNAA